MENVAVEVVDTMFQPSLVAILLLSLLRLVNGLYLGIPEPTIALNDAYLIDGWSPKPTSAPNILHDSAPGRGLVRRQSGSLETCAYSYVAGSASYTPLACPGGYACAYWTSYFACCTLVNGEYADYCSSATTCLGYYDNTYTGSSKYTGYDQVLW